jgi:hypothetical protein
VFKRSSGKGMCCRKKNRTNVLRKKGRRGGFRTRKSNQVGQAFRPSPLFASTADQDDDEEAGRRGRGGTAGRWISAPAPAA